MSLKECLPKTKKEKIWRFVQSTLFFLRDDDYYNYRIAKIHFKLEKKILKETNWLAVTTSFGGETHRLTFTEQAIEYFKYKNMIIQRRGQYVIIFLTITLLIMMGVQIYLQFFT